MKPAIIITGAASGLGREFARVAAREGMSVVLVDRVQEPLETLASEIRRGNDVETHMLLVDLASPEAGDAIERAVTERCLYCEVLVNNAGLSLVGPVLISSLAKQLDLVDVNIKALTELCLRFLPGMVQRGRGGILNVSSVGAYIAGPNMAVYNATKTYVSVLSAALAREVAGTEINVACLILGKVRTAMWNPPPAKPRAWMERLPESNAREVAEAGWRAFRRGKALIIPQFFYRLATYALQITPTRYYLHLSSGWFGPVPDAQMAPNRLRPAIVVTGASSGIGRALAARASRGGSDIALIGRSADALERLAEELAAAGASVHVLALDLARPQLAETVDRVLAERALYCDVLINAAGVHLSGKACDLALATQMRLLDVNVRAFTELSLGFISGMVARRRGGVLTVGPFGGGVPEPAVYRASMAYIASLSAALSCELEGRRVTVSCLRPGHVPARVTKNLDKVAQAALRGFRAGKSTVFVDWRHRTLDRLSWLLPAGLFRSCT